MQDFFAEVADGRMAEPSAIDAVSEFYGEQGPWYTVGWKMAVVVEDAFGRAAVVDAVRDPRLLLVSYNRAVREQHLQLPVWSSGLLKAVQSTM